MFSQLFGAYLVSDEIISSEKLRDLLSKASKERVKLGTIAVAEGFLTEEEADDINHLQSVYDKRFGDIAIERGYLDEEQVEYLLSEQGSPYMKFIQLLFDDGCISPSELEWSLNDFKEQNGLTQDDMDALKHEDIDQLVSLFAFAYKPYVTDIVGLLLRNITRFVTDDFYIGHIEHVDELVSGYMVVQRIFGDHTIYLGLSSGDNEEGFVTMASEYAKEYYNEINSFVYDTLGEFINMISGLFATKLSYKKISMDMEPPYAYSNQVVQGKGYVVPLYIHGEKINIYIAVDSDVEFAREPIELDIAARKGSRSGAGTKEDVVIVDDSALARRVLREILEEEGYSVVCEAVNGEEAIEAYAKYRPDIITLDITMPVKDGVEALRSIFEKYEDVTAIMVTAAGQEKKVIEALKIGAQNFVVKPFKKEDILRAMKK